MFSFVNMVYCSILEENQEYLSQFQKKALQRKIIIPTLIKCYKWDITKKEFCLFLLSMDTKILFVLWRILLKMNNKTEIMLHQCNNLNKYNQWENITFSLNNSVIQYNWHICTLTKELLKNKDKDLFIDVKESTNYCEDILNKLLKSMVYEINDITIIDYEYDEDLRENIALFNNCLNHNPPNHIIPNLTLKYNEINLNTETTAFLVMNGILNNIDIHFNVFNESNKYDKWLDNTELIFNDISTISTNCINYAIKHKISHIINTENDWSITFNEIIHCNSNNLLLKNQNIINSSLTKTLINHVNFNILFAIQTLYDNINNSLTINNNISIMKSSLENLGDYIDVPCTLTTTELTTAYNLLINLANVALLKKYESKKE